MEDNTTFNRSPKVYFNSTKSGRIIISGKGEPLPNEENLNLDYTCKSDIKNAMKGENSQFWLSDLSPGHYRDGACLITIIDEFGNESIPKKYQKF